MGAMAVDLCSLFLWLIIGLTAFYPELRPFGLIPLFLTVTSVFALISHFSAPIEFLESFITLGFSSLRGKMLSTPAYLIGANIGGGIKGMKNLPSPRVLIYLLAIFLILLLVPPIG